MRCNRSDNLCLSRCECKPTCAALCNVSKGAEIHAGDGGYSLGSEEGLHAFKAARLASIKKAAYSEIAKEAKIAMVSEERLIDFGDRIVKRCIAMAMHNEEHLTALDIAVKFGVKYEL